MSGLRREAIPGSLPSGATRNGLPGFHDYSTYRGKLPLAVELPFVCGCGRRTAKDEQCAACRGTYYYPAAKCGTCGYKRGGQNCRILCDGEPGTLRGKR